MKKYSAKIGDWIFLLMKAVKAFRSQGSNVVFTSMCLFRNATGLALAYEKFILLSVKTTAQQHVDIPYSTSDVAAQVTCHLHN